MKKLVVNLVVVVVASLYLMTKGLIQAYRQELSPYEERQLHHSCRIAYNQHRAHPYVLNSGCCLPSSSTATADAAVHGQY